jgi:hypothetical protein
MGDEDGGSLARARANGAEVLRTENREIGGCLPLHIAVVFPEEHKVKSTKKCLNQAPCNGAGLGRETLEVLCAALLDISVSKTQPPSS